MALPTTHGEYKLVYPPETRNGDDPKRAVTKLRAVAAKRGLADDGSWYDKARAFVDIKVFGETAINVAESMRKGDLAVVSGDLLTEEWENNDGQKRSRLIIYATHIGPSNRFRKTPHSDQQSGWGDAPQQAQQAWGAAPQQAPQQEGFGEPPF